MIKINYIKWKYIHSYNFKIVSKRSLKSHGCIGAICTKSGKSNLSGLEEPGDCQVDKLTLSGCQTTQELVECFSTKPRQRVLHQMGGTQRHPTLCNLITKFYSACLILWWLIQKTLSYKFHDIPHAT